VGWPPVRSFRKNMLAVQKSSTDQECEKVPGGNATFVKVSMDGAPYLRKVDLKMYKTYQELSDALGKMFSSFTIGTMKFTSPLTYIEAVLIFYICNSPWLWFNNMVYPILHWRQLWIPWIERFPQWEQAHRSSQWHWLCSNLWRQGRWLDARRWRPMGVSS